MAFFGKNDINASLAAPEVKSLFANVLDALAAGLLGTGTMGPVRETGRGLKVQAAPAAKTTTTTLTAAEVISGLLTANQGAAGAATYTMPLGTALETALLALFPGLSNDDSFDFNVINLSTVAAEDVTIAANTGVTVVGNMVVESNEATAQKTPSGAFRVRRTAANTFVVYRLS